MGGEAALRVESLCLFLEIETGYTEPVDRILFTRVRLRLIQMKRFFSDNLATRLAWFSSGRTVRSFAADAAGSIMYLGSA